MKQAPPPPPTPAERAALLSSPEYRAAARRLKAQLRAILDRPDARLPQEEDHDDQPAA